MDNIIKSIANRIRTEYAKYKDSNVDWVETSAIKIARSHTPNIVYVLHEVDHDDYETDVIGTFSTPEKVLEGIITYYGRDYKEKSHRDVKESGIEWIKVLTLKHCMGFEYEVTITLMYYELDNV